MKQGALKYKKNAKPVPREIAIRSAILNEVISKKPDSFTKYALFGVFFLIIALLVIAWFVPYPESFTLSGRIKGSSNTKTFVGGQDSFAVNEHTYYVECLIPQRYYTKATVGLPVRIRFEAFPYTEFGFITGSLAFISSLPADNGFPAIVILPKEAVTSQHKILQYKAGLKTELILITKNRRFLEHIFKKKLAVQ